jgi:hypothetical protein
LLQSEPEDGHHAMIARLVGIFFTFFLDCEIPSNCHHSLETNKLIVPFAMALTTSIRLRYVFRIVFLGKIQRPTWIFVGPMENNNTLFNPSTLVTQ